MSKFDKIHSKITSRPIPADVKWVEIVYLLKQLGYDLLKPGKTGGSRRKFYNRDKDILICCHEPHPKPDVDKGCISDIVKHLKENGLI